MSDTKLSKASLEAIADLIAACNAPLEKRVEDLAAAYNELLHRNVESAPEKPAGECKADGAKGVPHTCAEKPAGGVPCPGGCGETVRIEGTKLYGVHRCPDPPSGREERPGIDRPFTKEERAVLDRYEQEPPPPRAAQEEPRCSCGHYIANHSGTGIRCLISECGCTVPPSAGEEGK